METTLSTEFLQHAERFRRLDASDDGTGQRHVKRTAAAAAKTVKRAVQSGDFTLDIEGWTWPQPTVPPAFDDTEPWYLTWCTICHYLASCYPDRLPSDATLSVLIGSDQADGIRREERRVRAADWKERAAEFACVCDVLAEAVSVDDDCLVTLFQAAAMVHRAKRSLERYKAEMPRPRVRGGGRGKPDLWSWSELRPWLLQKFGVTLPERFPADRRAELKRT